MTHRNLLVTTTRSAEQSPSLPHRPMVLLALTILAASALLPVTAIYLLLSAIAFCSWVICRLLYERLGAQLSVVLLIVFIGAAAISLATNIAL